MTYDLKLAEYLERIEMASIACKKVMKGKDAQCPHCGDKLLYDVSQGIYCPNGDFKRYITPELMQIDGFHLINLGEVPTLSIVLKSDNEDRDEIINIDYIESYNNEEIVYRSYTYTGWIDHPNTQRIISEPQIIKVKDIGWISSRIAIK